jgi:hypothetical protein
MLCINYDKKIVFIHIPKCAGSFTKNYLVQNYGFSFEENDDYNDDDSVDSNKSQKSKRYIKHFKNYHKHEDDDYKKGLFDIYNTDKFFSYANIPSFKDYKFFSFVRNPYTRFISGYIYFKNNKFVEQDEQYFVDINTLIKNKDKLSKGAYSHIFITQKQHLGHSNYIIGRMENLEDDLTGILKELDVEKTGDNLLIKRNNNTYEKKFYEYYDTNILKFVNEFFDEDFKEFHFVKIISVHNLRLCL